MSDISKYLDAKQLADLEEDLLIQNETYGDAPVRTFHSNGSVQEGFRSDRSGYIPLEADLDQGQDYKYDMPSNWRELASKGVEWYTTKEAIETHDEETTRIVEEIKSVAKARLKQRTERELIDAVCHS